MTHIIIEDTNRKESFAARTKAISIKANTVQDKLFHKRYVNKTYHNNKKKYKHNNPHAAPSNPILRDYASNPSFKKKELVLFVGSQDIFLLGASKEL